MKKGLLSIALLAICLGLNAQLLSTKKSNNFKTAKVNVNVQQVADIKKQEGNALVKQMKQGKLNNTLNGQQVIYSEKLKNGAVLNFVKLKNGQIKKQLLNHPKQQVNRISTKRDSNISFASSEDATLYEGFEGWNEQTKDWLPTGWTREDKTNSGLEFTWLAETASDYFEPYAGNYMVRVQFAMEIDEVEGTAAFTPSEEWLITPAFTPKQNERLSFKLNYSPFWIFVNQETYEFDQINQNIEVLVSEDNGTNWTKIWDVLPDAQSFTEDELWDMESPWRSFSVALSAYVGKSIKIAFRYENTLGESACLDEIKVAVPNPSALYARPDGYFYWTFDEDYSYFGGTTKAMLGPAYEPAQWYNFSNNEAESFSWEFTDPTFESETPLILTDVHPVIEYPYAQFDAPTLTASAPGAVDSIYNWGGFVQTGGRTAYLFSGETEPSLFGGGNYDVRLGFTSSQYAAGNHYFFGTGSENFWEPLEAQLEGIANFFEKPLHKYMVEKIWIHCGQFAANSNAELQLIIHRVVDGYLADTIATSICYGNDVQQAFVESGYSYHSIPFTFKEIDPETGRDVDTYLEIEDAILVELKGFTDGKVTSFDPFFQYENHPTQESNAYIWLNVNDAKRLYNVAQILSPETYTSFLFNMAVIYPFLHTTNNKYEAPIGGGTANFEINSYWNPENSTWWLEEEYPDWIELGELSQNQTTGAINLPVSVSALPAGTSGRSANIKLASFACNLTLQIKQGDADYLPTGISFVKTIESAKVSRQGDNFQLSYPASATSVSVYNIAGQRVGEYKLNASGTYTLPAANLANGVYVLKFNGANTTVKIVK
jgi:hypothetical protein